MGRMLKQMKTRSRNKGLKCLRAVRTKQNSASINSQSQTFERDEELTPVNSAPFLTRRNNKPSFLGACDRHICGNMAADVAHFESKVQ